MSYKNDDAGPVIFSPLLYDEGQSGVDSKTLRRASRKLVLDSDRKFGRWTRGAIACEVFSDHLDDVAARREA